MTADRRDPAALPAEDVTLRESGRADGARSTRRLVRRAVASVLVAATVALLGAAAMFAIALDRYTAPIERIAGVFDGLPEESRPDPVTTPYGGEAPVTFLVLGSDSRAPAEPGALPTGRTDVIMLVRITGDGEYVQTVSIPRDSWVAVPGYGMAKINAAYAWGGPTLLIQTVENLTGNRIDHFAILDFAGFEQVIDTLGGIDVTVAETTSSRGVTFTAGVNHLDGAQALIYARQRYGLPRGDLDRVARHQAVLRAVLTGMQAQDLLTDPGRTDALLLSLGGALQVDDELTDLGMVDLILGLAGIDAAGVTYLTAPVSGLGREGAQSVVYLDDERAPQLWAYLAADTLAMHAPEFAEDALAEAPR